jgi:hypothetical protein
MIVSWPYVHDLLGLDHTRKADDCRSGSLLIAASVSLLLAQQLLI